MIQSLLRDLNVTEHTGVPGIFQDGSGYHFHLSVFHRAGLGEVGQVLGNAGGAGQRHAVETVVDIELDRVNISQAGGVRGCGADLAEIPLFTTGFAVAAELATV